MTDTSASIDRGTRKDFRIGRVFDRTFSVYARNFFKFFLISLIASTPGLLALASEGVTDDSAFTIRNLVLLMLEIFLTVAFALLSEAVLAYGAFQDMRGRPVNLVESLNIGLSRFLPIVGLSILAALGVTIGLILLIIPGLIMIAVWFVAVPVCVVEHLSPWQSLKRSAQLTKGHRWTIFIVIIQFYVGLFLLSYVITHVLSGLGGDIIATFGDLIWSSIWGAFVSIFVVVTYYELRAAKEGVDIEQIAAVFD